MKILFSPSESKSDLENSSSISNKSFIFEEKYNLRKIIIDKYAKVLKKGLKEELSVIFGVNDIGEVLKHNIEIENSKTCCAILRYNGVSYSYLDYNSLNNKSKEHILNNTVIFSNLFGPILAKDNIPYYKLKQGVKLDSLDVAKYYKQNFSEDLDNMLLNEDIIDLRASYYEKFYTIKKPYTTFKFIKNGKSVSHFSKAYRGIILRTFALHSAEKVEDILQNIPNNLQLIDKVAKGNKIEIVVEIKN